MRALVCLFALVLVFLTSGTASAQEAKGWLGADVLDVTKAEAEKLGWDSPHGAKLGIIASGSPADKAGLKTGDIIDLADGVEVETGDCDLHKFRKGKNPNFKISEERRFKLAESLAEARGKMAANRD